MSAQQTADFRGFAPAVHNRIAALLRTIEAALERTGPAGPIYARGALARRLLQEVAFQLDSPLRRADAARALQGRPPLAQDEPVFRCGRLVVDSRSGRVRPGPALFLDSLGRFAVLWLAMLWLGALALLGRAGRSVPGGTVVFGVPEEGMFRGDDAAFADFARQGPVAPFNAARRLFVQSMTPRAVSTDARIRYARHPLLDLLRSSPMTLAEFLRFALRHLSTAARFLFAAARFPLLAILWRDYGLHAPVASLDERGRLDAVVLTNSNWWRQLLCLSDLPGKRFELHFAFYSQNDRPTAYTDIEERCAVFPTMRLLRADHFWVWTPGHAELLAREGIRGQMHVAGPITWEVEYPISAQREKTWIAVFDITPHTARMNRDQGLLGNYYSTENLIAFLDGIEAATRMADTRLPLVIKPKRNPPPWADPRYLERCTAFRQLAPTVSAVTVIEKSALVIVYPFSTVAYLADRLGVPAIYFDPTGRLAATHEPGRCIRFARSVPELAAELHSILVETCPAS